MASLLIHVCCAHCAAYCVKHWQEREHQVTLYWYNPNIHPYQEYQYRLEAARTLAGKLSVPLLVSPDYDAVEYFRSVRETDEARCSACFRLRLGKTARLALERGFDQFTTTLLISPQQKHDLIVRSGQTASLESGVKFAYEDLRKRYGDSRHITKNMDIYRQRYCGCMFSEWEACAGEKE
jgi:epoxyqueuosine reductase